MRSVTDFSPQYTVNNSAYNTANKYSYTPPAGRYLVITEFSISGDSTFESDGRLQIEQGGNPVTSEGGEKTEINPVKMFTAEFGFKDGNILYPNQSFVVSLRTSSGTGTAQVMLKGMLLDEIEFQAYQKKYGLGV